MISFLCRRCVMVLLCLLTLQASPVYAQEPESCRQVRFADIGWTDITATTALASLLFDSLGYKPTTRNVSVPISLVGLKNHQLDVSLGYWDPIQTQSVEPLLKAGSFVMLDKPNLVGARTMLAAPSYVADGGLKSVDDIAKYKDQLDGKIYGIEPGSSANSKIQAMIDKNLFGLGGFKLVQSSEAGMLSEVQRAARQNKWIVFFAWEPHPMNIQMKLTYLTGGDSVFGVNSGAAQVHTLVANDYLVRCPNAGKLISNLQFTTDIENHLMASIMAKTDPATTAREFLRKNPQMLEKWLAEVSTFDGRDGLQEVKKHLAM